MPKAIRKHDLIQKTNSTVCYFADGGVCANAS